MNTDHPQKKRRQGVKTLSVIVFSHTEKNMSSPQEMKAVQAAGWVATLNGYITTNGLMLSIAGKEPVTLKSPDPQLKDILDGGCWMLVYFNCGVLRVNQDNYTKLKAWLANPKPFGLKQPFGPGGVTFTKESGQFDCAEESQGNTPRRGFIKRATARHPVWA